MPDDDAHGEVREPAVVRCRITVADYEGDIDPNRVAELEPIRVVVSEEDLTIDGGTAC